jgi:curved DNA-binding protein CbpA
MEGTLDKLSVPEIFRVLHARRESGILHLFRESTTKRVYFKDGAIVFASSSASDERLGQRLLQDGALTQSDLDLACKVTAESHLRLGRTLVDMGYLSPAKLDEVVKQQITSILCSVFLWEFGAFRTEELDDPVEPDLARRDLSIENVLLEGVRRMEDAQAIRRRVESLQGPLSSAVDLSCLPPDLRLTAEEGFVLSRVDGATPAGEIAAVSPLGEEQTLRCVYALLAAGLVRAGDRVVDAPAPVGPSKGRDAQASPEALRLAEEMLEKSRRAAQSTLYELLDVDRDANPQTIKSAYFHLIKRLHPDHRAGLNLQDREGVLDELYLKVKDAYEVLSDEHARLRYDFGLERRAEKTRPAEERSAASSTEAGSKSDGAKAPTHTFTSANSAQIHFANGERYFRDERYHEAIEELRNAVRLDPSRGAYHRLLGQALVKNPKWRRQAEEQFWKAIAIDRFDAESYLELGDLYEQSGLDTRARKMYEEALGVDPDNARALDRLAGGHGSASALGRIKGIFHLGGE